MIAAASFMGWRNNPTCAECCLAIVQPVADLNGAVTDMTTINLGRQQLVLSAINPQALQSADDERTGFGVMEEDVEKVLPESDSTAIGNNMAARKDLDVLETPEGHDVHDSLEDPNIHETQGDPDVHEISEDPVIREKLEGHDVHKLLEDPDINEIPEDLDINETPDDPDIYETPEVPDILETQEIPDIHQTPEDHYVNETLENPGIHLTPGLSSM